MIAIDETGDKILLGRGVNSVNLPMNDGDLSTIYRGGFLESSTPLWQVLSNLVNHSRMLSLERCGKKRAFVSGMSNITLANLG
jgi:hypothetical protein